MRRRRSAATAQGPASQPADKQRILVAMIVRGQQSWFIKMTGGHDLIGHADEPGGIGADDPVDVGHRKHDAVRLQLVFEHDEIGDVAGLRIAHLQCHIGIDTLQERFKRLESGSGVGAAAES